MIRHGKPMGAIGALAALLLGCGACTGASEEQAETFLGRIEKFLPPDGEVRVLTITDKQFERMRIFWGKMRKPPEPAPCQLSLF